MIDQKELQSYTPPKIPTSDPPPHPSLTSTLISVTPTSPQVSPTSPHLLHFPRPPITVLIRQIAPQELRESQSIGMWVIPAHLCAHAP